jgi:hypothetical protein
MTILSEVNKVKYDGDGAETAFAFTFTVVEPGTGEDHALAVYKIDAAGAVTLLAEGIGTTDYSVAVTTYPGGGTVTYPASGSGTLATGEDLVIVRHLDLFQETDLENQGGYLPEVLETQLDELVRMHQQLQEQVDRCLKLTLKDKDGGAASADLPNLVADEFLIVNSTGDGVTVGGGSVATASASSATPQAVGTGGGSAGVGTDFSRDDHVHDIGTASDLVADITPQLGGNLDANGQNILIDGGNFIGDESGNEQIEFATTASAINHLKVTNAATGNSPTIEAVGGNTDIDINLTPKGTGRVNTNGTVNLGGDVDVNGNSIVSTAAGDINLTPDTTGDVILDGVKWPQADGNAGEILVTDGAGQLSYQENIGQRFTLSTTDATPTVIASGVIASDQAMMVHVEGVARDTSTSVNASGFEVHNLVLNDGGITGNGTQTGNIIDFSPWALDVQITGDDTTDVWQVTCTGVAATNINWVLHVYLETV